jgi:hypothetical protein
VYKDKKYSDIELKDLLKTHFEGEYGESSSATAFKESVLRQTQKLDEINVVPFNSSRKAKSRQKFALILAASFLLVFGSLFVTPLGSWAQSALDTILGRQGFTQQTPNVTPVAPNFSTVTPDTSNCSQIIPHKDGKFTCIVNNFKQYNQAEAGQIAGIVVKRPTYLPTGYRSDDFFMFVPEGDKLARWSAAPLNPKIITSQDPKTNFACANQGISLAQYSASITPKGLEPIGEAKAVEVQVAGVTGAWIEGLSTVGCGGVDVDGKIKTISITRNILLWEKEGVKYRLDVLTAENQIALAEMIKIAESLT